MRLTVLSIVGLAVIVLLGLAPLSRAAASCGTTTSTTSTKTVTCAGAAKTRKPAAGKSQTAAKKGGLKPRSEYSQAERDRIMERARQICRQKLGAPAKVYRVDYSAGKVWCAPPSM